ncbi:MBL fold metallo-hydrolase (plasmid) [Brevundimonas staleyi]|uniref:MBL fold metallo-hydrolase n=1 Tax=Brevundimonas staleyi TaxID=74326 RepID=A0ABW0FRJ7_9CAUL
MARAQNEDGPHPVDRHVGARVRSKRIELGYNQSELGRALGLTFRSALTSRFPYIFESIEGYPAILDACDIPGHGEPWSIEGAGGPIPVVTFDQAHGPIRSVGYRLGGVSYSSDVSGLDEAALEAVRGCDLWIVDALRWTPHPTHANVETALGWIERAQVGRAVLTNLHIDLDYKDLAAKLPPHVEPAFDGWTLSLS